VKLVKDRGTILSGFTCPFHGWCWGVDGQNTFLYQPDLFSEANRDPRDLELVACRVELWGGCAFINFDNSAPPLRDSIEPFATMHDAWKAESLRVEWWLAARLPVNWKLAMEAFMEGYHVMETHPQLLPPGARGRKAVYSSVRTPGSARTAARAGFGPTVDSRQFIDTQIQFMRVLSEGMAGMTHEKDVRVAEGLRGLELPADLQLATRIWRTQLNDAIVDWNQKAGIDIPDLNALDEAGYISSVNFCFPHFFLLPTYSSASSYRIRPIGPEETIFELWSLTRYPHDQERPPLQRPEPMAPDDPRWPPIPTQDFSNLPRQQEGLHAYGFEYMRLSHQVEGLIGNYQRLIDGYLAGLGYDKLLPALHQVNGGIDAPSQDLGF
jgi:phenylpropionate dioxygenase-like ring-hydroxylating dioxygenase large terminal subunit